MISRSRLVFRATLVLLIIAVPVGQFWYVRHREAQLGRPLLVNGAPDADLSGLTTAGPIPKPPESAWLVARARRYADILSQQPCDILVVPVQVEGYGFDRPNRHIMSWDLAQSLSREGTCVTDPALVDLALGDGQRRRDPAAILELARRIKARQVVTMFAGHDVEGWVRLTLQSVRLDPAHPSAPPVAEASGSITDFKYSADNPPFLAVKAHLAALFDKAGLKASPTPSPRPVGEFPAQLPASPEAFSTPESTSMLADASKLMFLATLAPARDGRTAERLFAKAWVSLAAAPASPQVNRLRARILFHLRERPYALSLLKSLPADQALGLRALLDGNLPEARAALAQETDPWEQFFLAFEVHDLERVYWRHAPVNPLAERFSDSRWRALVEDRWSEAESWTVFDSLPIKKLLDQQFPVPGFSLDVALLGNIATGKSSEAEQQRLALRHLYRLMESPPPSLLAIRPLLSAGPLDLLDLIGSRIEAGLVGQTRFQLSTRSDQKTAEAYLDAYDPELAGEPSHELLRAELLWKRLRNVPPQQRNALVARLQTAAYSAISVDLAQSWTAKKALWYLEQPPEFSGVAGLRALGWDYPIRDYWNDLEHTEAERLAFSSDNADPLIEMQRQGSLDSDAVAAQLASRFHGEPSATEAWLQISRLRLRAPEVGQPAETIAAAIAQDPDNWPLHLGLNMAFRQIGAFDKASRAILDFPPFKVIDRRDVVASSNRLADAGVNLFQVGAFDAARPLLKAAVDLDTGSQSSIIAAEKLALEKRDYGAAASDALKSARSYTSYYAYGDLLRLMFASGHDLAAWATYEQLLSSNSADGFVSSARVGNRRQGISKSDLEAWLKSHLASAERGGNRDRLAAYALSEMVVDRGPEPGVTQRIVAIAGPSDAVITADGHIYPAHPRRTDDPYLGPSEFGAARHGARATGDLIPHRYALMAEAFNFYKNQEYELAVKAFDRLGSYYYIEAGQVSIVLPYFAFAAARTGDTLELGKYLDSIPARATNFNVILGRAVYAAMTGRKDESYVLLDRAYLNAPFDAGYAPIDNVYIYMDLCAQLFEQLHDEHYRAMALRAARTLRVTDPAEAAAHALIGYLGDGSEQVDELAVALYLDPHSNWANKAPESVRKRAESLRKGRRYFDLGIVPGT